MSIERDAEIVATLSCALYGERYAFIGLFIVTPQLRGNGLGSELFDRGLERGAGRVIGLDGVLAQQAYYERRGFELAHRNVRWRTTAGGEARPAGLTELASLPPEDLIEYDAQIFGADRARFVEAWIDRPAGQALASVVDGRLTGYGVLRECDAGVKVGPLFADDDESAELLLRGLIAAAPAGADVFVDMPAANSRAERLRESREVEAVFETVRMYRGGRPPEDLARVYGVTTLEFG